METSKSKSLKHRFAQFILRSSCSFKQLSKNPKTDPNPNPTRPVIQITIDCSGRRSVDATPPVSRSKKKKERRLTETGLLYQTGSYEGRVCPPVSPSSPKNYVNSLSKSERKGKEFTHKANLNRYGFFSSSSSENEVEFFNSDKEKQELISSRSFSFSSDSSEFYRRKNRNNLMKCGKKEMEEKEEEEEEEGFAVVKQSVDPYEDFRSSMVEMILEKKINGSDEMRKLLETYLELNSSEHHPTIVAAFADVWDAIFPKS